MNHVAGFIQIKEDEFQSGILFDQLSRQRFAADEYAGGVDVGGERQRCFDADGEHIFHRIAGFRVHDVGIALAVEDDETLVIAAGGNGFVVQLECGNGFIRFYRIANTDFKELPVFGGFPEAGEIAAEIDDTVTGSGGFGRVDSGIDGKPFGNTAQIKGHTGNSEKHRRLFIVENHFIHADFF